MKNVIKAAACVALLAGASAHADTFDFSYTFDDGSLVSGSLEGSLVGDTVQNVSDIHASYKGIAFTGTLTAAGLSSDMTSFDQPAVVSTDATKNNFAFTDAADNAALNAGNFLTFFEMTAAGVTAGNPAILENNTSFDSGPNGSWSLQPVPLPAGFLLFGSGLGLFSALRRCLTASN